MNITGNSKRVAVVVDDEVLYYDVLSHTTIDGKCVVVPDDTDWPGDQPGVWPAEMVYYEEDFHLLEDTVQNPKVFLELITDDRRRGLLREWLMSDEGSTVGKKAA